VKITVLHPVGRWKIKFKKLDNNLPVSLPVSLVGSPVSNLVSRVRIRYLQRYNVPSPRRRFSRKTSKSAVTVPWWSACAVRSRPSRPPPWSCTSTRTTSTFNLTRVAGARNAFTRICLLKITRSRPARCWGLLRSGRRSGALRCRDVNRDRLTFFFYLNRISFDFFIAWHSRIVLIGRSPMARIHFGKSVNDERYGYLMNHLSFPCPQGFVYSLWSERPGDKWTRVKYKMVAAEKPQAKKEKVRLLEILFFFFARFWSSEAGLRFDLKFLQLYGLLSQRVLSNHTAT
jgi:hypothetical protein